MAIQHENILKVLDVHYSQFSKDFIGFITKQQPTYKDRILEEDLFSPDDMRDDNTKIPRNIANDLDEVAALMNEWDCAYFRIIYT